MTHQSSVANEHAKLLEGIGVEDDDVAHVNGREAVPPANAVSTEKRPVSYHNGR